MPLYDAEGSKIITAYASKQSKLDFKIIEVHTSVMVPLVMLPVMPFLSTLKFAAVCIFILVILERRGWTAGIGLRRIRSWLAGRYRNRTRAYSVQRRWRIGS